MTQLIASRASSSMFFFLTLYMQNVLGYSPLQAGAAYLPLCFGVGDHRRHLLAAARARRHAAVDRRRRAVAAAGVYWLSRIPVDGSYSPTCCPGMVIMSLGLGAVFVAVMTAANAGVPADKAGLAAALLNCVAAARRRARAGGLLGDRDAGARHLLGRAHSRGQALTAGFQRALLTAAIFVLAAAVIAMRTTNSRGETQPPAIEAEPEASLAA